MNTKQSEFFNVNSISRVMVTFLIISICFLFVSTGNLQAAPAQPAGGTGDNAEDNDDMEIELNRFIKERRTELKALSQLRISASAGFSGHEAGQDNLYQLGLGVEVSKEMYPGEFRFKTATSLVIQNSKLQENVTLMKMSYEHYLASWLETYGFLERYSNSFLRIDYRYEIGGGIKAEYNFFPGKWRKKGETSHLTLTKYRQYIEYLEKQSEIRDDEETKLYDHERMETLQHLRNQEKLMLEAYRRKRSLLTVGLAVSFFAELEKPEHYVIMAGSNSSVEQERYRAALRPSFKFRPSPLITLSGYFYYKHPLFKKENSNDPLHYRTDTVLRAALNLTSGAAWTKSAALIFEYQRHYDNNPFGAFNANNESNVDPALVNKSHDIFQIQLNFEF